MLEVKIGRVFKFFWEKRIYLYLIPVMVFFYLVFLDLHTVDYGHHISIAKWYRENWFSLMDYTHGYVDLGTYPPLGHQLLALLSFVIPINAAYSFLTFIALLLISFYLSLFFLEYVKVDDVDIGKYLPILFFFTFLSLASIKAIFEWGQYTTIIGFAFGFMSLYYFMKGLRTNEKKFFVLFSLSFSLLFLSHHLSALIFIFVFALLAILEFKLASKRVRSLILFGLFSSLLIIVGNYPSLERFFSSEVVPGIEIPHESRMPITFFDIENWILSYYGVTLPLIFGLPVLLFFLKPKHKLQFFKLYLICIFLFLVGLGRWTPLTKIFLSLEHWLTYERFSMLSGLIFSQFFGFFLIYPFKENKITINKKILEILIIVFVISYTLYNIDWFFSLYKTIYGADVKNVNEMRQAGKSVVEYLNSNATKGYRYQVFGYRGPIADVYSEVDLPTLETIYFTGRKIEWLRNSSFSEINRIGNKEFLHDFLTNKSVEYSVKYIVTFYDKYFYKDFYIKLLQNYKWNSISTGVVGNDVYYIVWESPYKLEEIEFPKEEISLSQYLRGIVPLIVFSTYLILIFKYELKVATLNENLRCYVLPS